MFIAGLVLSQSPTSPQTIEYRQACKSGKLDDRISVLCGKCTKIEATVDTYTYPNGGIEARARNMMCKECKSEGMFKAGDYEFKPFNVTVDSTTGTINFGTACQATLFGFLISIALLASSLTFY